MKNLLLILCFAFTSVVCKANNPVQIVNGCYRLGPPHTVTITYTASAGGNDVFIWISGAGPLTPTSKTLSGSNWVYTYDMTYLGIFIQPGQCLDVYAWWDNTTSYNDVVQHNHYIRICPCIDMINGCYRVSNGHLLVDIRYSNGVNGDPIYIWINGNNGPVSPLTMVQDGSDWIYTYDISGSGALIAQNSCIDIFAWRDTVYTNAVEAGSYIRICPCKLEILEGCYRPGVKTIITLTYGPEANGNDIYIWVNGSGPVGPATKTQNGSNWIYTYDISSLGLLIAVGSCLDVVAWWDNTTGLASVLSVGTRFTVCPCLKVINGCYRATSSGLILSMTYDADAGGNDIFIWVNGSGPLAPLTKVLVGSNWVYTYNLSLLGIFIQEGQCLDIYAWWKASTPVAEVISHNLYYRVCPCKIEVIESCYLLGPPHLIKMTYGPDANGNPIFIWVNGSGPLSPISITPNGANWDYVYDMTTLGIWIVQDRCIDVWAFWDNFASYEDVLVVGTHSVVCPCCNATFTYCANSDNPYKVTFTPNTLYSSPTVDMDFGDGTGCTNCTIPVSHVYTTEGVFKACMTITREDGKKCTYCTDICITQNEVEHPDQQKQGKK